MSRPLPRFSLMAASFPDKHTIPTKALLDNIGGEVRRSLLNDVNTCAIRISAAINGSNDKIRRTPGLYFLPGKTTPRHDGRVPPPSLYLIRARDILAYLRLNYGPGKLIYDAIVAPKELVRISSSTQGIIVFDWRGRPGDFGALGHADLFRLWPNEEKPPKLEPTCASQCYWWPVGGPMRAYFWEAPQ